MRLRGFELITQYKDSGICLPSRKTRCSAGYDLAAAQTVIVEPGQVMLIATGLKAYMQEHEYLGIHIRSSLAVQHNISLANGQGIIDADYYNNADNEGHILIAVRNNGQMSVRIDANMRIAQGIFYQYLRTDADKHDDHVRSGGFGSTGGK